MSLFSSYWCFTKKQVFSKENRWSFVGYSEEHKHKGPDRFDESRFFSSILSDLARIWGENLEQQQLKAIHEFKPLQQCGQTLQQSMSSSAPTTYNIGGSTVVLRVSAAFIFGFSAAHAQAWPVHVTAHSQTYSLYDKQVNGAGAWRTVHQTIYRLNPLNRKRGTLQIGGVIASHLTVIALSIPYWSFVTSGRFPVARAFSQCAEPQRGRC